MVGRILSFVILASVLLCGAASSQDCIAYTDYLHRLGSYEIDEPPDLYTEFIRDIAVTGDTLYFACRIADLMTARLTEDNRIEILGIADTTGATFAVAIKDEVAYVAKGSAGLRMYDVSDLTSPSFLGHIDTPGSVVDIEFAPGRIVLADYHMGIYLTNTPSVREPRITAFLGLPDGAEALARAQHLYMVAGGSAGLFVVDISRQDQPRTVGHVPLPNRAICVAVQENLVVVGNSDGLMHLLDITDPANPELLSTLEIGYRVDDVVLRDDLVLVDRGAGGLVLVDVSDPVNPTVSGYEHSDFGGFRSIALVDDRAIAADKQIHVLQLTTPTTAPVVNQYPLEDARFVAVSGDYAYVGAEPGFHVVDISDPASPATVAVQVVPGGGNLIVTGDHLFIASRDYGFRIFNVVDPANPVYVRDFVSFVPPANFVVNGDHLYAAQDNGFAVFDISDPGQTRFRSRYGDISWVFEIAVHDDHVLIAANYNHQIVIVDVSDPWSPVRVGECLVPRCPRGVTVDGDLAYVSDYEYRAGFRIFDISNLPEMTQLGVVPIGSDNRRCVVRDGVAYLAEFGGLRVVDVSDPVNPRLIGSHTRMTRYSNVALHEDYVLAVSEYLFAGLTIAWPHCPSSPAIELPDAGTIRDLVNAYPNPFNPRTTIRWRLERPEHLRVCVHDLAGRLVAELADRRFADGDNALTWNGRDSRGRTAPSGVYLVTLRGETFDSSRRVSLIR